MTDIDSILNTIAQVNPFLAANAWRGVVGFGTGIMIGMIDMTVNRANNKKTRYFLDKNSYQQLGLAYLAEVGANTFICAAGLAEKASEYMANQHFADDLGGILGFMCGYNLVKAGDEILKQEESNYRRNNCNR